MFMPVLLSVKNRTFLQTCSRDVFSLSKYILLLNKIEIVMLFM